MSLRSDVNLLNATWEMCFPDFDAPGYAQWAYWLRHHGLHLLQTALARLERRYRRDVEDFPRAENLHRFLSGILRKAGQEAKQDGPSDLKTQGDKDGKEEELYATNP